MDYDQTKIYAHSSCIKGLTAKISKDYVIINSSGYDQRLKTWRILGLNGEKLKIEKVGSERHSLSDMNWMNRSGNTLILAG